ncbi:MAG: galactose-1-phosphate uridylyltransferase [Nitrospirae bacterium]|nr:MAG: galactose-1-phosphate uridylyltransferase [Nitrospirota bacterium]
MPELRKDPVIGRWVIISIERGKRPSDFASPSQKRKISGFCPFCEGNEYTTPPEITAIRKEGTEPNGPGWELRVVPNKFPALQSEGELEKTGEGIFDKMNGVGAHEVIIETPDHMSSLATMPPERVEAVLKTYFDRINALRGDERVRYVLVFKNEGEAAGASLEHTHSQLIALPIVPKIVKEEVQSSKTYFDMKERCIFCDIILQEREDGSRVIFENDEFIALSPYAPRAPFETWILPKRHFSSYQPVNGGFRELSQILQRVLKQMDILLDVPPYNFMIHTSPFNESDNEYYHWHIELMPKLTKIAGFEWGSGFYINPTPPEVAAEYMRKAEPEN